MSILLTYLIVATATQMYAGVGTEGLGLGNQEISDNVFGALAEPVMGHPWNLLLFLAVLASSAASLITTFLPTSRTMLGMAAYKALPPKFATIHPRYLTPSFATVVAGVGAGIFYGVLTFASENVLTDTIYSLGIMICFYYGLTAFALYLVLPQGTVREHLQLRVQVPLPAAGWNRPVRRAGSTPCGTARLPTTAAGQVFSESVWC